MCESDGDQQKESDSDKEALSDVRLGFFVAERRRSFPSSNLVIVQTGESR